MRQPLCRRRALLKESFSEVEGEFVFARSIDSDNTDTIAEFLEQSVRGVCVCLYVCETRRIFILVLSLTISVCVCANFVLVFLSVVPLCLESLCVWVSCLCVSFH